MPQHRRDLLLSFSALLFAVAGCDADRRPPPDAAAPGDAGDHADAGSSPMDVDAGTEEEAGPLRIVFVEPTPGREYTCADDEDGRLGGFGPIHVRVRVLGDSEARARQVVCQSSGGHTGYYYADVVEEDGGRFATRDLFTGYQEGTATVGIRCEAIDEALTTLAIAEVFIVETIEVCLDADGFACGGC